MTPGELLDLLGVDWVQVTEPDYGYDGTFTPRCAFGHWTASAAGSDVSDSVLWSRSYHACVARSGVVKLGGWEVRQGHGGEGRSTPMRLAVSGAMTLDALRQWQASAQADDTSSGPNQYGYGVCLDNNGVGEQPLTVQWHAWCAAMAAFAVLAGAESVGSVIDHSASTNRKIDLSGSPAIDVAAWWSDVSTNIDLLTIGPAAVGTTAVAMKSTDTGLGYWILAANGGVFTYGDARFFGSAVEGRMAAGCTATDLEVHPNQKGYWIIDSRGQVHPFGYCGNFGSAVSDMNP